MTLRLTTAPEDRRARWRYELRRTGVLALPLVVGQLLTIALNVIDTKLAGGLGRDVLSAVTMGYPVWVLALLIVIGVLLAVTPAVAQRDGAGSRPEVGAVFRQALWIAGFLGLTLFFGLRSARPLLDLTGVDPAIVPDALRFLDAISWGAPALALFFVCKNTSDGLSLTRPMMFVSLLGVAVLLPVAWVLMYGKLGLPALGAAGAGYAHAAVLWVQSLTFLAILRFGDGYREARLFERFDPPDAAAIGRLLAVGVPMGVAIFMEGTLFVVTALLAGSFGKTAASAHGIAINVASVTFMVPLGIAMATTVRVGNAVGRRDARGVAWAGASGFALAFAVQAAAAVGLLLLPRAIAGAYTDDAEVIALAATLLGFAALFQLSDGAQALFNGALRGLEDVAVPAGITIVAYWGVGLSLGLYFGKHLGQGPVGLWKGLIAGLTVAALLLCARFVQQSRILVRDGFRAARWRSRPEPIEAAAVSAQPEERARSS